MLGKLNCYMTKVSIFLIMLALIAGMVGCDGVQYNLTMTVAPGGSGTATDLTNASPYAAGTEVSIEAVANSGYWFVNWTAPAGTFANANAPQTTFTMPAQNVMVTANFAAGIPVRDWYDLDAIRYNVTDLILGGNYILMNDIDSTAAGYEELASPTANGGKGWEPIGTEDQSFTGSFDGQGYEICDLFINRPDEDYVGLFGVVDEGGHIENIGVVNTNVTGSMGVGSLVGANLGIASNSYATGSVTGYAYVGGLVGGNGGNMSDSYATGNVTGYGFVGGLVGENFGIMSNSYATGSVTGNGLVGGLVGWSIHGTVSNSYATGSVTSDDRVGGLVGVNDEGTVSNSYSTGSVTGNSSVGGLLGENRGTVSNSYATGSVTGNSSVGGLVADNWGNVSYSFWDTETSGQATSDGGTGKNTTEMQNIATFSGVGWNITAVALNETNPAYIWNIVNNVTYPFLSWQP
jgi:hypothetical protein